MVRACSTHGSVEKCIKTFGPKPSEKITLGRPMNG
jgi:hypothetical protein